MCMCVYKGKTNTHFSVAEQHQQNEGIFLHELSLFGRNWLNILPIQRLWEPEVTVTYSPQ